MGKGKQHQHSQTENPVVTPVTPVQTINPEGHTGNKWMQLPPGQAPGQAPGQGGGHHGQAPFGMYKMPGFHQAMHDPAKRYKMNQTFQENMRKRRTGLDNLGSRKKLWGGKWSDEQVKAGQTKGYATLDAQQKEWDTWYNAQSDNLPAPGQNPVETTVPKVTTSPDEGRAGSAGRGY